MGWDLDFLLELARGRRKGRKQLPLVQVGEAFDGGRRSGSLFVSSHGRIGAHVKGQRVFIKRNLGRIGKGVGLSFEQLKALGEIVRHWISVRDEWAEWEVSFSGVVATYYYRAPGRASKQQVLGTHSIYGGGRGRAEFYGRETRRRLQSPLHLSGGVVARWAVWRTGEPEAPAEGSPVGLVYHFKGGSAKACRSHLLVRAGSGDLDLEAGRDEAFIGQLARAAHCVGRE